ncbi:MAG: hypothetical protein U0694_15920 [Anaerolineae bacterium]
MTAQSTSFAEYYAMVILSVASQKPGRHWEEAELAEETGLTPEQFLQGLDWAQAHQMLARNDNSSDILLH